MKKIVVFTGAGISAESGLSTFRDNGGLWDNYDINEVATPEAWTANPELVLDFYNMRRKNAVKYTCVLWGIQEEVSKKETSRTDQIQSS